MRFVLHCALLLLAFVGLANLVDHWTTPAGDDESVALGIRQLQPGDDSHAELQRADHAKNYLSMNPVMVLALGIAAIAVYRPGLLSRRLKVGLEKWRPAKKGSVV